MLLAIPWGYVRYGLWALSLLLGVWVLRFAFWFWFGGSGIGARVMFIYLY
jgi:hypothetical protein